MWIEKILLISWWEEKQAWDDLINGLCKELGSWDFELRHNYFSLQYSTRHVIFHMSLRYYLQVRVECLTILSHHFSLLLSWKLSLSTRGVLDGTKRPLIVNSLVLNDADFEDLMASAILAFNVDLFENPLNGFILDSYAC